MEFKVLCWNPKCKRRFTARDKLPGSRDYMCPACGMRSAFLMFTKRQMERGIRFKHLATGKIVDTRYQRRKVDFRPVRWWIGDDVYYCVDTQDAGDMNRG